MAPAVALILGARPAAFAQDPAPPAAADEAQPEEEEAEEAPPAPAVPRPKIAAVEVRGGIDPPGRVEAFVAGMASVGASFVEEGPADEEGVAISTVGRLRQGLERIGYHAVIQVQPPVETNPKEVRLAIDLRAADRVRQIFVDDNWPLRQEEIISKITLRPGQALPPVGPERDARLMAESSRIQDFLREQGYLDANVRIELHGTGAVPSPMNLKVMLDMGKGYPIRDDKDVLVKGNQAIPSKDIVNRVRHFQWFRPWDPAAPFRTSVIKDDLRALEDRYRELGYPAADLTHVATPDKTAKKVRLNINVNERKKVEVAFEGNESRSDDRLRDELLMFEEGRAAVYNDFVLKDTAEALAQGYRERGHMFVTVDFRRERLSPQVDRVTFKIVEGPSLRVRSVSYVGNKTLPASALSEVVNVRKFPLIGYIGLGGGGYASLRQLAVDADNLVAYHEDQGFPDAQAQAEIAPAPGQWRPISAPGDVSEWQKSRSVHVRFVIEEGQRQTVRAIRFRAVDTPGWLPRDDQFLRGLLLSRVGEPLRRGLVRQDAERLRRYLGDLGFIHATVFPDYPRSGADTTLTWDIKLGPQVQVGPIFFRGNFLTREDTILLWVPLRTGQTLTTTGFERGQRNLALIQLFNSASPISFPGEDPEAAVAPVLIEVEERHDHWGVLKVGGGASTEQAVPGADFPGSLAGYYGEAGYEHRNLFGRGWTATGRVVFGNSVIRGDAGFTDPRFFGSLFRLEVAGGYRREATVRLGDTVTGAGSIGFGREMYPGVDASLRYNLRSTTHPEFLLRSAGAGEGELRVNIETIVGSLSAAVEWQRLDNPLLPTRGFKFSGNVEVALPSLSIYYGTKTFVKLTGRYLTVVPLLPWLSLRHSLRYDHGFPFDTPVLPKAERFFAGGDTTIRGFELDKARTETIRAELVPDRLYSAQYRPVGGNLRVLHNLDLQFPIIGPLYAGVFIDSGVVADSLDGLRPFMFRHGAGIAPLLLRLPIGDLAVSWAWPLDPQPGDARIGRLHLNVGLMF